ncbi:MAG: alpha-L-fucosidase [Tepidisphaeraceae bacterium]
MPTRRELLIAASALGVASAVRSSHAQTPATMPTQSFEPSWDSLQRFQTPDWFRDAKFGIWAHWGPQCQPEAGDWYARHMYVQGHWQYNAHVKRYGHPSKFGFKDVINDWKAEKWDPEALLDLYAAAGAKYFFALANHHDNFDLYDSKHHNWNSTKLGPKKDLIGGWAKAARARGLRFGVSVHAAHAWSWYETAQAADKTGDLAGIPYDGTLHAEQGKGTWWQDFDPQELYAQNHKPAEGFENPSSIHGRWDWGNGAVPPTPAWCESFHDRTIDLIDKYQPDLIYFDDTVLPLHPISDVGLRIAAHMYNASIARAGKLDAVVNGKILDEMQRRCMVWDIERGQSHQIEPLPWQTDTCIGDWHYNRDVYNKRRYKSAALVIHTLADVVSKNGNLLLSVPVRGDGTIDELETEIVKQIGAWMKVNAEAIHGTRPWKVFGEGPASASAAPIQAQGFNEGKGKPLSEDDVRFTTKGDTLYAIVTGKPTKPMNWASLASNASHFGRAVQSVRLLGSDAPVKWKQTDAGLSVEPPATVPNDIAAVFVVE